MKKKALPRGTMTLDKLATMVANGFESIDGRFDAVEGRLGNLEGDMADVKGRLRNVESDMADVKSRLRNVERDVAHIHDHMVYSDEFEDLSARVKYVEEKLGIDSGR